MYDCVYRAHLDSLLKYVEDGQKEGANLVYGGKRVDRPGESCPLVLCDPVMMVCGQATSWSQQCSLVLRTT